MPPAEPRLLILDDDSGAVSTMERGLRRAGMVFQSRQVQGREDFLAALEEFSPDVILAEISAPVLGVQEALRLLRERQCSTPLLVLARTFSVETAMACVRAGAADCLHKEDLESLPAALERVLKRRASAVPGEEPCRVLAESAGDLAAVLDAENNFVYANPAYERELGHAPGELTGADHGLLIHPEDVEKFRKLLREVRSVCKSRTAELRCRHQDGRWLWFETSASTRLDAQGQVQRVVLISRDINERKREEREIQHLAEFPRLNPNPVLAFAADGTLTYFNDAATELACSLQKKHPRDLLPLNTPSIVKMCLATGQTHLRQETTVAGRTLAWSFYPILAGQVVHCYAADITNRLNLEAQLLQAQKMESVGQLAAGVAHDFNNILTIIQGHSGLMMEMDGVDNDAKGSLRQITIAAQRAANLTRQLLMFSRKQLAQPQIMDWNEGVKSVAKMLRVLLGENIALHLDLAQKLPAIYADPGMMEQVLMNLGVNARDAMRAAGTLTIATTTTTVEEDYVRQHPGARAGQSVRLSVTDTGCGMDEATRRRIFEPFFTTKEVGKGTGLGLATVYGIVKQHNGWLEVDSTVGQGTTFHIFLPASSKSTPGDGGPVNPDEVRGGAETILVVEDEMPLRELVVEVLQRYGYKILTADSGPAALEVWRRKKEEIDLLLTDMMMPGGISGGELAARILGEEAAMKVIYTSGYSVEVLSRELKFKPGVNFLQKPYVPQILAQTVRDCLDA